MEKLLQYILQGICESPKEVEIEQSEDGDFIQFTVSAKEEDVGKIIGKGGRNIKSIQTLLSIPARRENKRVSIKVEPKG